MTQEILPVIPKPQTLVRSQGVFLLAGSAEIAAPPAAQQGAVLLQQLTGLAFSTGGGAVRFEQDAAVQGAESYTLDVTPAGIRIGASAPAGFFYGAQTLRQLLPPEVEQGAATFPMAVPCVHIADAPRFQHRGFLLDVSRHFFGPVEIKRIIDLLALQKINRFHWHLTDDQGWRIEIKKYPRLVEIGSQRKESQSGGWILSKPTFDGIPHRGYYTQDEIREVVAYAAQNFIEVIPEIDAPGHAAAAMAAYPELSCDGRSGEVRTTVSSFSNPLCVGKEFVFTFLEDVFSELAELFPYRHIHIGGDEVNKKAWKKCPDCQARLAAEGLKTPHDLQVYFENRLVKILKARGCEVITWSEVLHPALDPDVINQYWFFLSKKKTVAAIQKGRRTIVSEFSALYLDYSYKVMPLRQTYDFDPQFTGITVEQAGNILGVEAALWTEFVDSRKRIDWQMFPRVLAASEMAWTEQDGRSYEDFLVRLALFERRLRALGVAHAVQACYLQKPGLQVVPHALRILFSKEHPALAEYRKFTK